MGKTLQFNKDQNLSIEGAEYRVTGGIEFHNRSDGSRWWEYCLLETRTRGIKWLSIDNIYEEYAIYTQCPYGSEFDEMNIFRDGYRRRMRGRQLSRPALARWIHRRETRSVIRSTRTVPKSSSLRWSNGRMKQSIPKAVIWIWMKSYSWTAVVPDRWRATGPLVLSI